MIGEQNRPRLRRRTVTVDAVILALCCVLVFRFPARADELQLPLVIVHTDGEPIAMSKSWFTRFRGDDACICFDFANTAKVPISEVDFLVLFYDGDGRLVKSVPHRRTGFFSPGVPITSPRSIHERGVYLNCWYTRKPDKAFFAVQSAELRTTGARFVDGTEWISGARSQ